MDDQRRIAWATLAGLTETAHPVVEKLLWPQGRWNYEENAPRRAQVEQALDHIEFALSRDLRDIPKPLRAGFHATVTRDPARVLEHADADAIRLLTPDSPEWPHQRLSGERGADATKRYRSGWATMPYTLWAKGRAELAVVADKSVAFVGTRNISHYGRDAVKVLLRRLSNFGYSTLSGGALGVDTSVHRYSLDNALPTIAVMAQGLDNPYPKSNTELFERIQADGLLLGEYPEGTPTARHRFLSRNRIIALLSRGTVIVEAPWRSGALNTASWALSYDRPLMAVPGPITLGGYAGCHDRIKKHQAELVTTTEDIVELLDPLGTVDSEAQQDCYSPAHASQELSESQLKLFDCVPLQEEAVQDQESSEVKHSSGSLEVLARNVSQDQAETLRGLHELERLGLIVRHGSQWQKIIKS